jgi:hypothetical protein
MTPSWVFVQSDETHHVQLPREVAARRGGGLTCRFQGVRHRPACSDAVIVMRLVGQSIPGVGSVGVMAPGSVSLVILPNLDVAGGTCPSR